MDRNDRIQKTIALLPQWYGENKRDLPWRKDPTPYHIWLSEIIFQQTRIEAGTAYYLRFLEEAPTVEDLAAMPEEKLLKLWEGLGYYNRARNLHKTAKIVAEERNGVFPEEPKELEKLPGIGKYTAGAISSIAWGKPVPAVDGNVLRVFARILADERDIALPETRRSLEEELQKHYEGIPSAGDCNQAIMDLGATVCIPNGAPRCQDCPLKTVCLAAAEGKQKELPVKSPAKVRKTEERTILLIRSRKMKWPGEPAYSEPARYYIRKRPKTGLLADLWELPGEEGHLKGTEVRKAVRLLVPDAGEITWEALPPAKHVFSHLEWHMTGYLVDVQPAPASLSEHWKTKEEIDAEYSLPSAFKAYRAYIR